MKTGPGLRSVIVFAIALQHSQASGPKLSSVQIERAIEEGSRYKTVDKFMLKGLEGRRVKLASAMALDGISKFATFYNDRAAIAAQAAAANQQMRQLSPVAASGAIRRPLPYPNSRFHRLPLVLDRFRLVALPFLLHDQQGAELILGDFLEADLNPGLERAFQVDGALEELAGLGPFAPVDLQERAGRTPAPLVAPRGARRAGAGTIDIVRGPLISAVEATDFDGLRTFALPGTKFPAAE